MIRGFLNQLVFPINSDALAVYNYMQLLGVPVTKTRLAALLSEHPESGTLLSVSDALTSLGVGNVVVNVSVEKFKGLEMPFIAKMKFGDGLALSVVKQVDNDDLVFLRPTPSSNFRKQNWVTIDKQKFSNDYEGIILIAEADPDSGQSDYAQALVNENKNFYRKIGALAVLPMFAISAVFAAFLQYGWSATIPALYTLLFLAGTAVGGLLIWYEVDRYNPVFRQVCANSKKVNCDVVLNSKASRIFGVSFSLIGFSYFFGSLMILIIGGIINAEFFTLLSLLSLIAIGFTVFSLYYQWRVAQQWCKLCLWIQGVLALQAVLVFVDGRLFTDTPIQVSVSTALTFLVCFTVPFLAGILIISSLKKGKKGESDMRELSKMKHNAEIFYSILEKQKTVTEPPNGLGITLGNSEAKHRIIKVCSPYCSHCATAHPVITEILQQGTDVQVQIIFLVPNEGVLPVSHLLAVSEKGDEMLLKKALDDWYLSPSKDYEAFAQKYPMNGELQTQNGKLQNMQNWCERMEIAFTPTIFLNGYQLPEIYSTEDLKYFLKT